MKRTHETSRRRFLRQAGAAGAGCVLIGPAWTGARASEPRHLSFHHLHTDETLSVVYWENGRYVAESLDRLNRFLRDWRAHLSVPMDPALFDLLFDLRSGIGTSGPFHVICGYRTAGTNERLRERSSGVAKNSQHIQGKAIDVRLAGVPCDALRDAAIALGRGGVGFYAKSDFVHVDTGRPRTW